LIIIKVLEKHKECTQTSSKVMKKLRRSSIFQNARRGQGVTPAKEDSKAKPLRNFEKSQVQREVE
jgi:hypothetical protein